MITVKSQFIIGRIYKRRFSSSDLTGFDFIPKKKVGNKIEWVIKKDGKILYKGTSVVRTDGYGEYVKPRGLYAIFA